MSVDMSFFLLPIRFRGTPRLLHPKTIHIAPRRVLVSFYPYITNICWLCKKITSTNENIFSLPFLDLGEVWVDQRFWHYRLHYCGFCGLCGMCTSPNTSGLASGLFGDFHILLHIRYTFMFLGRQFKTWVSVMTNIHICRTKRMNMCPIQQPNV